MTPAQIRILALVFDGSAVVVGLIIVGTMGMRFRSSVWRLRLKVIWIALLLAMCVRSFVYFASLGSRGVIADAIYLAALVAAIWYRTIHRGWAGWWMGW